MEWFEVAKRRMKDLDLTQEDFIEPLGIKTRGAVGHYFTGRRTPTPAQFKTIADKLHMSMDELFTGSAPGRALQLMDPRSIYNARPDEMLIPRFAFAGSMGPGLEAPDEHPDDVVHQVRVNVRELRKDISFTAPRNLAIITGKGDSMADTFKDGDPLIMDTGVTELNVDGVYVLEREAATGKKELMIKRVQRHPIDSTVIISSDNPLYRQQIIIKESDVHNTFQICGRVLLAWNARKL